MLPQNHLSSNVNRENKAIITALLLTLAYPAGVVSAYMWDIGPAWLKLGLLLPFALLLPFFLNLMISVF